MNSNIYKLVKLNLLTQIHSTFRGKSGKLSIFLGILSYIFTAILAITITFMFHLSNNDNLIIPFLGILLFILTLGYNALYSTKALFSGKDFNILLPLPIKSREFVLSKIISLYLVNTIVFSSVAIPILYLYAIVFKSSLVTLITGLFVSLIYSIIPLTISILLSSFISRFLIKFRYAKQLFSIIGAILGVLIYIYFYAFQEKFARDILSFFTLNLGFINSIYPPLTLFSNAIIDLNFLNLMKLTVISILVLVIGVYLLLRNYIIFYQKINSSNKRRNNKGLFRQRSTIITLFIKNLQQYFDYPIYVVNTIFGPLFFFFGSIFLITLDLKEYIVNDTKYIMDLIKYIGPFIIFFFIGTSITTYCGLSIEGRNNWIVLSLPVETKDIVISKVALGVIIATPAIIMASIAYYLKFNSNVLLLIITIFTSFAYSIYSNLVGLWLDIKYANYEWTDVRYIVKNRLSVLYSMLLNLVPNLLLGLIVFSLKIYDHSLIILTFAVILITVSILIFNKLSSTTIYAQSSK